MQAVIDRIVQYPNRYQLTNVETQEVLGTFDFDEVTGTVQQVGTEIDAELFQTIADDLAARVKLSGGELKDTVVTFSDISGTAANVASGDTSATLWGKVKNWFSRLKALAFKNKVAAGDFEAGAIKNADVAVDAAIAQSKVSGLENALDAKANDADLAAIAKSGDLADATQDATHRVVTDTEKATWNGKANTSGDYPDMTAGTANSLTAVRIPNNADLNDYVGSEYWGKVFYATGEQAISNSPVPASYVFHLEVLRLSGNTVQVITAGSSSNNSLAPTRYFRYVSSNLSYGNWEEIVTADGSYPTLGAGYLQHQGISSVSSSTIGWYKVGTTSASKIVSGNGSVSVIFLVNGVYQIENTATPTRSGLLELDVTKLNGNFTAFTISVLGGALDPEQFFGVLENNVVTLYWRNVSTYGKVDFTILTQQDETLGNWSDLFEFDIAFYGATAPSGAVYAVNRNVAAKVENALTIIKDGVSTVYNGSEAKTVEIPENGGITVIEIPANESGTLTSEQLQQVKNNPQNTVIRRNTVSSEMDEIYCFDSVNMSQGADSSYTFRNVTSMAQNSLTLQAIAVNLNSGVWIYSSVQTSAGGGGSGIAIVTIPQDGVSTNPAMSGTIELASPENTVIKIYNGEDNDGARYTYSILTSFDENASGDVPEYVYSGEDYIVTCTKSNGNTYNYTLTETSGGGGTQLYRHKLSFDSGTLILISTESRAYNYGSAVQRALVNFAIVSAMFIGEANEGTALLKTSSITVGSVSVYYFATEGTTTLTEVVISRSQSLTDEVTPL